MRYIKPRVAQYLLRDFTVAITSKLLAEVAAAHDVNVDTIKKVRSNLSAVFRFALAKGAYPGRSAADNPCAGALIPKARKAKQKTIAASFEEVKAILAHLGNEGLNFPRAAIALVAYTGVRPGEARGLRWEDWDRAAEHIHVQRAVWHAREKRPKTGLDRYVTVVDEMRSILLPLWKSQGSPLGGYILARADGGRANLDNESKRVIHPAFRRCAICKKPKAKHTGHVFVLDESLPQWHGWYSLRRFHGTAVCLTPGGNLGTSAGALGNSKAVAERHYVKLAEVLPDVRNAVKQATMGLI